MHRSHRRRGAIAIYVTILLISTLVILAASLRLTLGAATAEAGWDVRRQRVIAGRSLAQAVKEAVLATAELAPATAANPLGTELDRRVAALVNAGPGVTLTGDPANAAVALPANPQWPGDTPVAAGAPTVAMLTGAGRNLQALLGAGNVADLGTRTFAFNETDASLPTDATTYSVHLRFFSVPLTNFNWIAYGRPTSAGGISAVTPPAPAFTPAAGFAAPLATASGAQTGTFTSVLGGAAPALPYFYRDLVGLTWNAFEYWISGSYQSALLAAAQANIFDFANPGTGPGEVTWDGTRATVNLETAHVPLLVFVDSLGGSTLRLNGASEAGAPLCVAIRNFSATPTTIEIAGNNARSVLLYAPNSRINPATAGLNFRGGVLFFANTQLAGSWAVNGFVAYPQTVAPPSLVVYPDDRARQDLEALAPRALLVSARGLIQ